MLSLLINGMIYLGSILMVNNIYWYAKYIQNIRQRGQWETEKVTLYSPLFLLVMFLVGYLVVGIFGQPDLVMSSILFFGSVYVAIIVHVLHRITQKIQENERLQAELMASEESNRAKTSFLSNMSHEIRTPLNAIIGLDNIALRNPSLPPQTRDQLEKIHTSAQHLLSVINGILDMTRIESGKMELKKEVFSLPELIRQVNVIIQGQCDDKKLNYVTSSVDELNGCFIGDPTKIRQVLINILGNAVKFTPPSGFVYFSVDNMSGTAESEAASAIATCIVDKSSDIAESSITASPNTASSITVSSAAHKAPAGITASVGNAASADAAPSADAALSAGTDYSSQALRFIIRDTGIGMEKEFLAKIFEPFSQEDSTTTNRYGGSGLGLSLTKRIVDLMGGDLTVESEKGKGSTFTLTLFLIPAKPSTAVGGDSFSSTIIGINSPAEGSSHAADDSRYGADDSRHGADDSRHGADDSRHGADGSRHGADDSRHAADDSRHSITDSDISPTVVPSVNADTAADDTPTTTSIEGRHILIVEDIEMNAEILADLLQYEKATTEWAMNGKIALDMFNDSAVGHFDAILMDMRMPVMDGLTAARHIRALTKADAKTVPIIALTANAFEEDVQQSLDAGMNAHLSKPIEPDILYETLAHLTAKQKARE